jgi:hypothetical protein
MCCLMVEWFMTVGNGAMVTCFKQLLSQTLTGPPEENVLSRNSRPWGRDINQGPLYLE